MRLNLVALCAIFIGLAAADCEVLQTTAAQGWDCSQVGDLLSWADNTLDTAVSNLNSFDGSIPQWNRDYNVVLLQQAKTAFFMVETDIRHRNPTLNFVECPNVCGDRARCDAAGLSALLQQLTSLDDKLDAVWSNPGANCHAEQDVVTSLGNLRCALDATIACLSGYNAVCGDAYVPQPHGDNGCVAPQQPKEEPVQDDSSNDEQVDDSDSTEDDSSDNATSEDEPEVPKVTPPKPQILPPAPQPECGCDRGCSPWVIPPPRRSACPCCPEPKPEPIPIIPECPVRPCEPWGPIPEGCPGSCGVWGAESAHHVVKTPNVPQAKPAIAAQPVGCSSGSCHGCRGSLMITGWEQVNKQASGKQQASGWGNHDDDDEDM